MPVTIAHEGGRMVARKTAVDQRSAERLEREAHFLERFRHPGVVELVAVHREAGGTTVVTTFAGQHTLATIGPLPVATVAEVTAALADTLADLHASGSVHGRLDPTHVIIGAGGQPVLCGFGAADGAPGDDIAAVSSLLQALLTPEPDVELIPSRRWPPPRDDGVRGALLTLADQATADDPAARPSAADLAAAIRTAVDGTRLAAGHRWPTLLAAAGGLALVVFGVATLQQPSVPPSRPQPTTSITRCGQGELDIDGDGCGDAITVGDRVIEAAGRRWLVGAPGDRVVLGDWDCDGVATPAVLRPATGEVFVFPAWNAPGGKVVVTALAAIDDASDIRAATDEGRRCPKLIVDRASGAPVEILR